MLYLSHSTADSPRPPDDGGRERGITFYDKVYPPDVDLLQRLMLEHGVPYDKQYALWLDFYDQYPDIAFGNACLERAQNIYLLNEKRRAMPEPKMLHVQTPCSGKDGCKPTSPFATQHFHFNNKTSGYTDKLLYDSLLRLSKQNLLPADDNNLDNAMMAFGVFGSVKKSQQKYHWVRWNGKLNSLHYLIDLLIEHNVISCGTQNNERWIIVSGSFIDANGNLIAPSRLSNSNQLSYKSQLLINQCMLGIDLSK